MGYGDIPLHSPTAQVDVQQHPDENIIFTTTAAELGSFSFSC